MSLIELREQSFESGVFGRTVARLACDAADAKELRAAAGRWSGDGQWLVSCRTSDAALAQALLGAGFVYVETLVTFERPLTDVAEADPSTTFDVAHDEQDADACSAIARGVFTSDRFHADRRLPRSGADELKAAWIRNSVNHRADVVIVVRDDDRIIGFNACMHPDPEIAVIDLIAVASVAQGLGVGRRLVTEALSYYAGRARVMRVGTQASNEVSCRLYRSCGFVEIGRADTYHWLAA